MCVIVYDIDVFVCMYELSYQSTTNDQYPFNKQFVMMCDGVSFSLTVVPMFVHLLHMYILFPFNSKAMRFRSCTTHTLYDFKIYHTYIDIHIFLFCFHYTFDFIKVCAASKTIPANTFIRYSIGGNNLIKIACDI